MAARDADARALGQQTCDRQRAAVARHHAILVHVEIVGVAAEHRRCDAQQLVPQLAGRLEHRVAGHVELSAGRGGAGQRGQRAVGHVDGDARQRHAEDLGRDLAERGGLAAAHVGAAAADDEAAVHLEADPRAGPVVQPHDAPVRLEVAGEPAADLYMGRTRRCRWPQRGPRPLAQFRDRDVSLDHLADGQRVASPQRVHATDRDRIHSEGPRDAVQLGLVREHGLHGAESAHGAGGRVVGVRDPRVDLDGGDAVRARRRHRGIEQHERREVRVGAGVGEQLDLLGDDLAVRVRARAIAQAIRVTLGAREQRLLPRPHHLHRPPRLEREQSQVCLDGDVLLAAEAAAEIRADDAHAVLRDLQHLRHVAEVLDHLRGEANRDDAVGVDPRHARLGLEVRGVDELRRVLTLDDDVCAGQCLRHITPCDAPLGEQVARPVHRRRARSQRGLGREHAGRDFVLDLDRLDGVAGQLERLGGHQRDGLALVTDAVLGQHVQRRAQRPDGRGLAWDVGGERVARDVLRGQDDSDAGHRRSPFRFEPDDPR